MLRAGRQELYMARQDARSVAQRGCSSGRTADRLGFRASLVNVARRCRVVAPAHALALALALTHAHLHACPLCPCPRAAIRVMMIVSMALWIVRYRNSPSGHGCNSLRCLFPHTLMQTTPEAQREYPREKGGGASKIAGPLRTRRTPRAPPRRCQEDPPRHRGKPKGGGLPALRHWPEERGELTGQGRVLAPAAGGRTRKGNRSQNREPKTGSNQEAFRGAAPHFSGAIRCSCNEWH